MPVFARARMPSIWLFVAFTGLLVVGCATPPPVPLDAALSEQEWQKRRLTLSQIDHWQFSGRVAVSNDKEGWQATVRWTQTPDGFEIRLAGPFGQGNMLILGDQNGAVMRLPDGEELRDTTPEALVSSHIGWHIPLEALRYWVIGLPAPGAEKERRLDAEGRITAMTQSEWGVEYRKYTLVSEVDLPKKLVVARQPWRVKLVIDEWGLATRL